MKILRNNWLSLLFLLLIIIWLGWYAISKNNQPVSSENNPSISTQEMTALAQCLTDKGFKLYGAFWCGHCQEQKTMFGDAFKYINYIECSGPDGNSQTAVCTNAGVELYPTWGFPNGQKVPGVMTSGNLIEVSGCKVL
ncbi:MAG: hypothetical protein V1807_02030 [Patescibacteria group bacterium]